MGTFFVYIEIIPELKNVMMGELVENPKKITSIIQINTFIKICSINSFESWLLVIRLKDVFRFFQPSQSNSCLNLLISCFGKISPDFAEFWRN